MGRGNKVKVLILDDFYITGVDDPEAIEDLMTCQLAPGPGDDVDVCLVHTYDTWTTSRGISVEIGCGLTEHHFNRALRFLGRESKTKDLESALATSECSTEADDLATPDSAKGSPWDR